MHSTTDLSVLPIIVTFGSKGLRKVFLVIHLISIIYITFVLFKYFNNREVNLVNLLFPFALLFISFRFMILKKIQISKGGVLFFQDFIFFKTRKNIAIYDYIGIDVQEFNSKSKNENYVNIVLKHRKNKTLDVEFPFLEKEDFPVAFKKAKLLSQVIGIPIVNDLSLEEKRTENYISNSENHFNSISVQHSPDGNTQIIVKGLHTKSLFIFIAIIFYPGCISIFNNSIRNFLNGHWVAGSIHLVFSVLLLAIPSLLIYLAFFIKSYLIFDKEKIEKFDQLGCFKKSLGAIPLNQITNIEIVSVKYHKKLNKQLRIFGNQNGLDFAENLKNEKALNYLLGIVREEFYRRESNSSDLS
jgi:hypothetical protein